MSPPTLRRYDLPHVDGEGWATIVIDTRDGLFATMSDWGNYCYRWSNPGTDFRAFLARLSADYLVPKLASGRDIRVYDAEATADTISDALYSYGHLDGYTLEHERKLLEALRDGTEDDFKAWCNETKLPQPYLYRTALLKGHPMAVDFCKKIWPRFAAMLRQELQAEAAVTTSASD